jgi:DNA replication protein DnaC
MEDKVYGACSKDCPICGGVGYIGYDVPFDDPRFGKMEICPNRKRLIWFDDMGISKEEAEILNWSEFATRKSSTQIKRALSLLLTRGYGMLYIWGNPGIGKTALSKSATIIANRKHKFEAYYTTQANLIDRLRASYDEDYGQIAYKRMLDSLMKVPWLVVDEIGRDRNSDFSKAAFSEILNARYTASIERKACVTILISNFDPKQILDDYQLDRVSDKRGNILHVEDVSFRALPLWEEAEKKETDPTWWQKL